METQETRVAIVGIIVDSGGDTAKLNDLLHEYGRFIIGRMGIPYRDKNINIISVVMDAPADDINSLSGKLGKLPGINTKTLYAKQ